MLKAQEEKKVLVAAFLGENWCPWSEKLKRDVLNSPEFLHQLEGLAHFAIATIDEEDSAHNRVLQEVFHIEQAPTLVLFDYSQEEIARLGFLPLTSEEYAKAAIELTEHFEEVVSFLNNGQCKKSEEEMVALYLKAKKLSSKSYGNQILQMGLKEERGSFFLLEKYGNLLKKFKFKTKIVQKTRKQIMERDPDNKMGAQLKMAILEFQELNSKVKGKNKIDKAISPLVSYVQKFGKQDRENLWRVEMMIAQFLFAKNEREQALIHARSSLDVAPENMKGEVKELVDYLQTAF